MSETMGRASTPLSCTLSQTLAAVQEEAAEAQDDFADEIEDVAARLRNGQNEAAYFFERGGFLFLALRPGIGGHLQRKVRQVAHAFGQAGIVDVDAALARLRDQPGGDDDDAAVPVPQPVALQTQGTRPVGEGLFRLFQRLVAGGEEIRAGFAALPIAAESDGNDAVPCFGGEGGVSGGRRPGALFGGACHRQAGLRLTETLAGRRRRSLSR